MNQYIVKTSFFSAIGNHLFRKGEKLNHGEFNTLSDADKKNILQPGDDQDGEASTDGDLKTSKEFQAQPEQ